MQTDQFKRPLLIINGICLTMCIWFTYKHYLKNDGKGIDDIFYMFSIFTFQSYFGLLALMNASNDKVFKSWLIVANGFILLSAVFVEMELMKWISIIMIIPFIAYLISHFIRTKKMMFNLLEVSFIFALITSILPIFAFIMSIFSLIIGLVNPA